MAAWWWFKACVAQHVMSYGAVSHAVALGWVTHLECLASQLCRNPSPLETQQVGNELLQRQCVL